MYINIYYFVNYLSDYSHQRSNNLYCVLFSKKGNIAEVLLKEGFARCVDWSMAFLKSGAEKLRAAEKLAKEGRIRIWKDYQATGPQVRIKNHNSYPVIFSENINIYFNSSSYIYSYFYIIR